MDAQPGEDGVPSPSPAPRAVLQDGKIVPSSSTAPRPRLKSIVVREQVLVPGEGDVPTDAGCGGWSQVHGRGGGAVGGSRNAPPPRPVGSQAERAAYLKWMDGRCFRCLSRKHFAAACWRPVKCWKCFGDFHLASECSPLPRKTSSTSPPSGTHPDVVVGHGASFGSAPRPAGHASRPCSYAEALMASPLGDRSARPADRCALPRAPVEQDLLAAMLSAGPEGIVSWHDDPMLDEAMAPSPQVTTATSCVVGCSDWCDEVWLDTIGSSMGSEESVDPMRSEAMILLSRPDGCSPTIDVHSLARLHSSVEPLGFNVEHSMGGFGMPAVVLESQVEESSVVAEVTQVEASPTALEVFLSKVTCPVPHPLLGTPTPVEGEKDGGRRSGRLEKKSKACNIPTAKRAEHRLMDSFGELPEVSKVEGAEQKMQAYLDMYNKPLSPQTIAALSALVKFSAC